MSYLEEDLLPISALQHLLFCERQCALIHVEQLWAENRLTAEGQVLHSKVNEAGHTTRNDIRQVRSLPIRSLNLGIAGLADLVEFIAPEGKKARYFPTSTLVTGKANFEGWLVRPVEYKRGKPKKGNYDTVQLCAQALCLEEMLSVEIADGAIYYGVLKKRIEVVFDDTLRELTISSCLRLRQLITSGRTPPAVHAKQCNSCSLVELCLPLVTDDGSRASSYFKDSIALNIEQETPDEDES